MKSLSKVYISLVLLLLYAPVIVMVVFSFNEGGSLSEMSGVSLRHYIEVFNNSDVGQAIKNTLILAVSSAAISGVLGTAAAVGIGKLRSNMLKKTGILSTTTIICSKKRKF